VNKFAARLIGFRRRRVRFQAGSHVFTPDASYETSWNDE